MYSEIHIQALETQSKPPTKKEVKVEWCCGKEQMNGNER